MNIIEEAKRLQPKLVEWRRELHRIPEIAFELQKTSDFVRSKLEEFQIEHRVVAKTGIIGTIYGKKSGPTIALRADMDALPILEETGLGFASTNGRMHACGHDAHTAMLLGVALLLSQNKHQLNGNVRLIFQPAEENVGGAEKMIGEGCLEDPKVDRIYGLHIGSLSKEIGFGQIGVHSGATMAAVDDFRIRIHGKGGHGAAPHECIDPVLITSELVCALQKIVSREVAPVNPAVLTIGKIQGGTAFNIIPESVEIEGCVRTMAAVDRVYIEKRIRSMVALTAQANRASCEIEYWNKYPILINDETVVQQLYSSAVKLLGSSDVVQMGSPIMASEDMAYYLQKVPGAFFFLGSNNDAKGISYPLHHPKFTIDEDVLWRGPAVMIQSVFDILAESN